MHLFVGVASALFLSACGTITGIPSHGGGKRYAIEQELVAASARAAAKNLDLSSLKGRNIAVKMTMMGDQGAGNLIGGRYNIKTLLGAEYVNTPKTITNSDLPVVSTTTTTATGATTTTVTAENALNAPAKSETEQKGSSLNFGGNIGYNGIGVFDTETLLQNPRDAIFLQNTLEPVLYLNDINVVPEQLADTVLFISVDVFGTVRSRNDWHIFNQERLLAKTAMEIFAVDLRSRKLLIKPQTSSYEAEYVEQYALWAGPIQTIKTVKSSTPLLVDFSDMTQRTDQKAVSGIQSPLSVSKTRNNEEIKNITPSISREIIKRRRGE